MSAIAGVLARMGHVVSGSDLKPSANLERLREIGGGAAWDTGEWFVIEADESDGTFLELPAEIAVVTSVEPDHLEHYGGLNGLVDAFARFLDQASGLRVVCADDPVAARLGRSAGAISYGEHEDADYRVV